MNTFLVISLVILILYVYQIRRWLYYWEDKAEFLPSSAADIGISVVIAFRNEVKNLGSLLISLEKQLYPTALHEIILVDDNSDDGSDKIAKDFCENHDNFRYILNNDKPPGKKSAIRTGIMYASNEIIATTDADCVMDAEWLATISSFYHQNQPGFIIGLADIRPKLGFTGEFIEAEFISLIASGAGAAAAGHPVYCNGANLAFTKSLYLKHTGSIKENIASGDDTFLLHAAKSSGEKVMLLKSKKAIVKVKSPENLREFINQHIRWVSKSRYYTDKDIIITALLVLLMNLAILISLFLFVTGGLWVYFLLMPVKAAIDFQLVAGFYKYLGKSPGFLSFIIFSLVYPFYAVLLSFFGLFSAYTWKGRLYKPAE